MILLDTNVVSETMKRSVDPAVAAFIDQQQIDELFLPSLVAAEIRYGLRRLPTGRRRGEVEADFAAFLEAGFASRILAFDDACAVGYATVRTARELGGTAGVDPGCADWRNGPCARRDAGHAQYC